MNDLLAMKVSKHRGNIMFCQDALDKTMFHKQKNERRAQKTKIFYLIDAFPYAYHYVRYIMALELCKDPHRQSKKSLQTLA